MRKVTCYTDKLCIYGHSTSVVWAVSFICVSGLFQTFTEEFFCSVRRLGILVVTGTCVTIFVNCAFWNVSLLLLLLVLVLLCHHFLSGAWAMSIASAEVNVMHFNAVNVCIVNSGRSLKMWCIWYSLLLLCYWTSCICMWLLQWKTSLETKSQIMIASVDWSWEPSRSDSWKSSSCRNLSLRCLHLFAYLLTAFGVFYWVFDFDLHCLLSNTVATVSGWQRRPVSPGVTVVKLWAYLW